jgi:hypothetical protein
MSNRGHVSIDPVTLDPEERQDEIEIVIPYLDPEVTLALLRRAASLTAGLQARIKLVAVHTISYSHDGDCSTARHAFLVSQLMELSGACKLPVAAEVVLARSREDGLRYALTAGSTVLVGSRKRPWQTGEERLARSLASAGHKVALVHVEVK